MALKRREAVKKVKAPTSEPVKPQFVTEVVEELPVNDGVDVSEEALETIKESAEKIEEVVEEIQEKKEEEELDRDEEPNGETVPVVLPPEQKRANDKETLEELFTQHHSDSAGFTKESSPSVFPDITEHKSHSPAPVFLWAIIIIAVALLTGGTLLVVVSGLPKLPTMFTKPTPPAKQDLAPQGTPTPTPIPVQAARSDITIQILNGGGTPGSASKAKAFLEKKGYTIAETGNTEEYTYKKTELLVKPGKEVYLEFLKGDLEADYTIGTASATLPADVAFDARVIVGKK